VETLESRNAPAFSLMELLVVVGIIAILAALILGALSNSKKSAGITVCLNNAKMITMSLLIYAEDHGGQLPNGPQIPRRYTDLIRVNVSERSFRCPLDKFYWDYDLKKTVFTNSYAVAPGNASYLFTGFNYKSNFLGLAGAMVSQVARPELSAALAENPATGAYSWHEPATQPKKDARNVLGFVDGHVQQIKIYWDGKTDPILYNPPDGYSYRWTPE
jgi:prepilin-type N-terminal cleavage/methylation domain-containing protein